MIEREAGQSAASAEALAAYQAAVEKARDERCELRRLNTLVRQARAAVRHAEVVEARLLAAYEATPYADVPVSA